jgi:hypothetical protein
MSDARHAAGNLAMQVELTQILPGTWTHPFAINTGNSKGLFRKFAVSGVI